MKKRTLPDSSLESDLQSVTKKLHTDDNSTSQTVLSQQVNSIDNYIQEEKFLNVLHKKGIKKLFPIQSATFNIIRQGKDILARDRTGSGKTLAFGLPIIQRLRHKKWQNKLPKFLIILPTRQLAIQVENQLSSLKFPTNEFKILATYGKSNLHDNIQKLKSGVDIVVATPGRLNDLIERKCMNLSQLQVICLDEADEILKQGFKEQIEKVFYHIKNVNKKKVQTLLFSATIPQWLSQLSKNYQSPDTPYINLIKNQEIRTSKTIQHLAVDSSDLDIYQQAELIQTLIQQNGGQSKRVIIFCQRKKDVDLLSKQLKIKNQPLHGDIQQFRRQKTYKFFKQGFLNCIVATNVAARGLDFPSIDLVIQTEPPGHTEDYIHRAGRTGRAGMKGICITLFHRKKRYMIGKIEQEAKINIKKINMQIQHSRRNFNQDKNTYKSNNEFKNRSPSPFDRNSKQGFQKKFNQGNQYRKREGKKDYHDKRFDSRNKDYSGDKSSSRQRSNNSKDRFSNY